jgi:RES domain-containing protein
MLVYRLASRRYALDNSEGASIYGGRWNRVGTPVIYASGTISLAALEVTIHNEAIPVDHRVIVIEVPETLQIQWVELQDLSANWPDDSSEVQSAAIRRHLGFFAFDSSVARAVGRDSG